MAVTVKVEREIVILHKTHYEENIHSASVH